MLWVSFGARLKANALTLLTLTIFYDGDHLQALGQRLRNVLSGESGAEIRNPWQIGRSSSPVHHRPQARDALDRPRRRHNARVQSFCSCRLIALASVFIPPRKALAASVLAHPAQFCQCPSFRVKLMGNAVLTAGMRNREVVGK